MKKLILSLLCFITMPVNAADMSGADPVLFKAMLNQLEYVDSADDGALVYWDGEAWLGQDINKLWLKSEGERNSDGLQEHRLQLLYNRAIRPYWDVQLGVAHDTSAGPSDNWGVVGIHGTAPYFIASEIELFVGESGYARLEGTFSQDWLLNQRLVLEPELRFAASNKNAVTYGVGRGLNDIEANLRLRYEIQREFAPYIGVGVLRRFGNSKALANDGADRKLLLGISAWF